MNSHYRCHHRRNFHKQVPSKTDSMQAKHMKRIHSCLHNCRTGRRNARKVFWITVHSYESRVLTSGEFLLQKILRLHSELRRGKWNLFALGKLLYVFKQQGWCLSDGLVYSDLGSGSIDLSIWKKRMYTGRNRTCSMWKSYDFIFVRRLLLNYVRVLSFVYLRSLR